MNGIISHLPDSKSPTLALVHPTLEEQLLQTKRNAVAWRGALSVEAYMRRETHLLDQDLTRNGGTTQWALVDTAARNRVVLAACESYRKRALVARDGNVKEVICHGIGSVFCPTEFRGRGYAGRMMKELGRALRTWQAEDTECLFSVLYSDIGKQFYAAHGWEPFPSSHISLPADPSPDDHAPPLPSRPLHAADIPALCALDEQLLRTRLARCSSAKTAVALVPDAATIAWHHAREDFVARELHGRPPAAKGLVVGAEPGRRVWAYWARMWYNPDPRDRADNTLHVLRLVVEDQSRSAAAYVPAIEQVFWAAQREAAEWNAAEVEVWNPEPETVQAARGVWPDARVVSRDRESIASLAWYGEAPEEGGSVVEAVEWVGNEKYGWC